MSLTQPSFRPTVTAAMRHHPTLSAMALLALVSSAAPALAQVEGARRIRLGLGAQVTPRYPGSDDTQVGPFINVDIARGDTPFAFEAMDETAALTVVDTPRFGAGPSFNFQNSRRNRDVGVPIGRIPFTFEAGAFAQYMLTPGLRVRADVRRGVNGHEGVVGEVSADAVLRDGDRYVISIGPRATYSNGRYQRAYFGVNGEQAVRTGLPVFNPGSGFHSVGGTIGALYQFTPRWGLMSYGRYDRLIGDAADSPLVRGFGSRNQFSAGLGLTYTFTRDR